LTLSPQRPVLFINPVSGGGKAREAHLSEEARERGIKAIVMRPGEDLGALVDDALAAGADALGMAGGDGSMWIVAAAASAHGLPFICVPAGTRNHFARDLGVSPNALVGALDAFADGLERRIDLNVTLGVYGIAVQRTTYRDAKVRTLAETAREVLGPSGELPAARLVDDRGREHVDPAVVLVSNNPYALHRPGVSGMRPALDGGRLGVLVLHRPHDRRHPPARGWTAQSLRMTAAESVAAGVDGEAVHLTPPLDFGVRRRALRVRVPRVPA
jgi:diacylglycerol kinase family enzyme